jgi:hypothetical protein
MSREERDHIELYFCFHRTLHAVLHVLFIQRSVASERQFTFVSCGACLLGLRLLLIFRFLSRTSWALGPACTSTCTPEHTQHVSDDSVLLSTANQW